MPHPNKNDSSSRAFVVSRWLEYEGEMRSAFLRTILVAAFYALQLLHFLCFASQTQADIRFHRYATGISVAWLCASLIVLVALSQRWLHWGLKYLTTLLDLLLLTLLASLGSGPASPLVFVFGLLIVNAGLRGSLPLVWFATLGAMVGYLALVGSHDPIWFDANHSTPVIQVLVVETTLIATGAATGQLIRMMRQVFLERIASLQSVPRFER